MVECLRHGLSCLTREPYLTREGAPGLGAEGMFSLGSLSGLSIHPWFFPWLGSLFLLTKTLIDVKNESNVSHSAVFPQSIISTPKLHYHLRRASVLQPGPGAVVPANDGDHWSGLGLAGHECSAQ